MYRSSSPQPSHEPIIPSSSRASSIDDEDGLDVRDEELLAQDPLQGAWTGDLTENLDPMRKVHGSASQPVRLRSSPFTPSRSASSSSGHVRHDGTSTTAHSYLRTPTESNGGFHDTKDDRSTEWSAEGLGKRVAYDDLTAIDWIYEYSKERTRLRHLQANASGLLGQLRLIADASQIWLILVATGIAVGGIAAGIDVVGDWLGDLKTGSCSDVRDGGKFYLNRVFCCWGTKTYAECPDWRSWGARMSIGNKGGSYVIEYIFFVLFSVLFATLASVLVNKYAIYAKQSGIPEIKTVLGGFVIRRFLGGWTLLIKSLGLCLAVASGLWLGKEGPLVHVACCCANIIMKPFQGINTNEARKREVLSAAAASGISVAFGSPIGGVLFSLEQLSYYFPDKTMWASFVCAMVAAVTLQAFDPFRTGKLVLFQVTYHSGWHAFELVPFAVIGILGGLYGAIFLKLNMRINSWRASKSNPFLARPVLEVTVVALVTAIISYPVTFLRAQPSELVEYLFAECKDLADDYLGLCKSGIANTGVIFILLISCIIAILFGSVIFGLQIPAGILLPSMGVGALYGRVVGLAMELWQRNYPDFIVFAHCEPDIPCVTPGTYAVIGAASALAGATRMTVSIVVIMFELTGALTYVLPIMIAVMLSKWVGDAFGKRGIYESWIHFNGYPFLDTRDEDTVPDVPVSQVMALLDDLVCITATGHTIDTLRALLREHRFRGFPVIPSGREPILLGYISRAELQFALDSALLELPATTQCYFQQQSLVEQSAMVDLRPWMDQTPITLSARSALQFTTDIFQKLGLRYILFTERGILVGLLTKKDLWYALNEAEDVRTGHGRSPLREEDEAREDERGLLRHRRGSSDLHDLTTRR